MRKTFAVIIVLFVLALLSCLAQDTPDIFAPDFHTGNRFWGAMPDNVDPVRLQDTTFEGFDYR